jgi:hypothetical protein
MVVIITAFSLNSVLWDFLMFLKLHILILPLCNNPPAHLHHSPNVSDLTDVCQHFVVLLCNMEVTATAHSKKFVTFATLVSKVVTEEILWVRTKKSGWLT